MSDHVDSNLDANAQNEEAVARIKRMAGPSWSTWMFTEGTSRISDLPEEVRTGIYAQFIAVMKTFQKIGNQALVSLMGTPKSFKFDVKDIRTAYIAIFDAIRERLSAQEPQPA